MRIRSVLLFCTFVLAAISLSAASTHISTQHSLHDRQSSAVSNHYVAIAYVPTTRWPTVRNFRNDNTTEEIASLPTMWRCIINVESQGRNVVGTVDPRAAHYGWFQFSLASWHAIGGKGLPTNANFGTQFQMAQRLEAKMGWRPWAGDCGIPID